MTDNTKMREAFVQACKEYGPTISFSDFECGWDACMAWQAARIVPEGFVMVPVEPTSDMVCAAIDAGTIDDDDVLWVWGEMLSAAPEGKK